jgi:hypothetical protein
LNTLKRTTLGTFVFIPDFIEGGLVPIDGVHPFVGVHFAPGFLPIAVVAFSFSIINAV